MIQILPMEAREREQALLESLPVLGDGPRGLAMEDRGEALGYVAVELLDGALRILKLEAAGWDVSQKPQGEQVFVLDSLVRAAASYGETFGAQRIETVFRDFFGFFKARGFGVDESHAFGPMGLIVRYG